MLFRVCIECDHSNPPESRFCGQCGAPLHVRFCQQCQSPNDAESRHCQWCGSELPELIALPPLGEPGVAEVAALAAPAASAQGVVLAAAEATTIAPGSSGAQSPGSARVDAGAVCTEDSPEPPAHALADVLSPRPAHAAPILVDSAVTTANPATAIERAPRTPRRTGSAAQLVAAAVAGAAVGALLYHALLTDSGGLRVERTGAPAVSPPAPQRAPAPPADAAAAAPAEAPSAASTNRKAAL